MRITRLVPAALAVAALTACGSTVSTGAGASASLSDQSGLGVGTSGGSVTSSTTGTTGSGAAPATGPDASSVLPSSATDGGSVTDNGVVPGTTGPVATHTTKPIQIGVAYIDAGSSNAITGAIGKGLSSNDAKQMYSARIDWINAHGGIGGRKLQLITYDAPTSDSLQEMGQAACTSFTQDHHVDVVFDIDAGGTLYPCLKKAGIPVITGARAEMSNATLAATPLALYPSAIPFEKLADLMASNYAAMGWLPTSKTDKLGVLYYEDQQETAGFHELQQAVQRYGSSVAVSQSIKQFTTAAEIGSMEAAVKSAELRFKANGVTHVLCVETNAFLCGFFGLYAGQQGYYPKYAWNSDQPLTNVISNLSVKSLTGSVFIGWAPSQDLQEEGRVPRALESCYVFFRKQGFTEDSGNQKDQAADVCEELGLLQAAASKVPFVNGPALIQGAIAATSYVPYNTFGLHFTASQRDGVQYIRRGVFVPSCDCFRYQGSDLTI